MIEKESNLQESLKKQTEMEQKLYQINLMEYQQKQENERLLKVKSNSLVSKHHNFVI